MERLKLVGLLTLLLSLTVGVVEAQAIKNPSALAFTSADHDVATVTGYEIDITNATTGALVQTITVLKANTTKLPTGEIRVTLNVQPVSFGTYRFVARTITSTATIKSDNSVSSDTWDRAPGAPSKPIPQ